MHCECTILNSIHGRTAIPYIGVSKLSCAFCFQYFDAYNSHVPTPIRTRGTHSQSSVWRYPTTLEDRNIQDTFCATLRNQIAVGWKERGPVSADLQSTDPSADERPDNISRGEFSSAQYFATQCLMLVSRKQRYTIPQSSIEAIPSQSFLILAASFLKFEGMLKPL